MRCFFALILTTLSVLGYSQRVSEFMERGRAKYKKQDYQGAIADFTRAVEISPHYALAYYSRANAKIQSQDLEGALFDYTRAIANNPDADTYFSRGNLKARLQDYSGAIPDYDKVIVAKPGYAQAYYCRGLSKIMTRRRDSGCLDLNKAGGLGFKAAHDVIKEYCK